MHSTLPLRSLVALWLTIRFCRLVMPAAVWLEWLGLRADCSIVARLSVRICRACERFVDSATIRAPGR